MKVMSLISVKLSVVPDITKYKIYEVREIPGGFDQYTYESGISEVGVIDNVGDVFYLFNHPNGEQQYEVVEE